MLFFAVAPKIPTPRSFPEMMLRSAELVPPITLFAASSISTPVPFPGPIVLPTTWLPVPPEMRTPTPLSKTCVGLTAEISRTPFPAIMFRAPGVVPPTVAEPLETSTPAISLPKKPTGAVPETFRPMIFPSMEVPLPPVTAIPDPPFPEITLPAPVAVPPIVLF